MMHSLRKILIGLPDCAQGDEYKAVLHELEYAYEETGLPDCYITLSATEELDIAAAMEQIFQYTANELIFEEGCEDLAVDILHSWNPTALLFPNVLIALSILIRAKIPAEEQTLSHLLQTTVQAPTQSKWNYAELSRSMPLLPESLQQLFSVKKRDVGKPYYEIRTHYPELLMSLLYARGHAPFAPKAATACSYLSNQRFFRECLPQSFVDGQPPSLRDLEHFYLLERLFRLDMKQYLFHAYPFTKEPSAALSVEAAADLLFHSPLVFYNSPEIWRDGLSANIVDDYDLTFQYRAVFVHLMLQFESYFFPVCAKMLYGILSQYPPEKGLEQLEATAEKFNLTFLCHLLPSRNLTPTKREKSMYVQRLKYLSEPGNFELSHRAIRTQYQIRNGARPNGNTVSQKIYDRAIDWL